MALQSEQRKVRRQQILDLIDKQHMSMKEVSEALKGNYHTIRRDMMDLMDEGKISPTIESRNSGVLFRPGKVRPMPMVYHKASNSTLPLTDIARSYCNNPTNSASSRATLDVGRIAAEMLYTLALSVETSHPSHAPLQDHNRNIAALRARLTTDILHIESILGIAQSMLKDETLWSTRELEGVAGDTLFNANIIIAEYEQTLQTLQEGK